MLKKSNKPSLYPRYCAEKEWRGPSPRLSAWATQLRKNTVAVRDVGDTAYHLTRLGIEPPTSCTVVFTTTPTDRFRRIQRTLLQLQKVNLLTSKLEVVVQPIEQTADELGSLRPHQDNLPLTTSCLNNRWDVVHHR